MKAASVSTYKLSMAHELIEDYAWGVNIPFILMSMIAALIV